MWARMAPMLLAVGSGLLSVQLAFWLFVVFGLALYAILARSAPDEVVERRRRYDAEARRRRAEDRERVAARRPPAGRPVPAPHAREAPRTRPGAAARARPGARRKSPSTSRGRKATGFTWPFKWPVAGRKRGR